MRTFYKQILSRTYEIFGVNQLEKMDDDQITYLLDGLERMSAVYSYIPDEEKKNIINKRLITDKDFRNINIRLISGWFDQDGKIFFKDTSSYQEPEITAEPLTGEAREKAIETFLNAVANATTELGANTTSKGSGSRMKEELESHNLVIPKEKQYKPFTIEGLEIFARSEEEAKEIYNQTVSNDTGTTTDQKGTEGTNQDPGL